MPFVLIIGNGTKEDQRLIAEIFTQINTKSVPIDGLHKMYLSYKFGMNGSTPSDKWGVDDWETKPVRFILGWFSILSGVPENAKFGDVCPIFFLLSILFRCKLYI